MKKLFLILAMVFAACNAQARAVKLGDAASEFGTGSSAVKKTRLHIRFTVYNVIVLGRKVRALQQRRQKMPRGQGLPSQRCLRPRVFLSFIR